MVKMIGWLHGLLWFYGICNKYTNVDFCKTKFSHTKGSGDGAIPHSSESTQRSDHHTAWLMKALHIYDN